MDILEHFYLKILVPIKFGNVDISITNLTVSMFLAVFIFSVMLLLLARKPKVVPTKRQAVIEMLIGFVKEGLVYQMMGKDAGDRWFPFVSAIFVFILANNLVGLIPGTYTPTANPVVPLIFSLIVFFVVQITNIRKNGIKGYIRTFAPKFVPSWMYVIVFPIELISNWIAKPLSLFIRLTANMLAGHIIIIVLQSMIIFFKNYLIAVPVVPFATIMMGFEIFVSAIQAYIFAVLSAMYIGNAENPMH
ncbi:MAG: F0F1 ATP synthase subunit A [Actinobacteria bacterium]|nr:F0F1 ATP synthase subunit A [Actinomycetota bacterium]